MPRFAIGNGTRPPSHAKRSCDIPRQCEVTPVHAGRVLTINTGSSSLKVALYDCAESESLILTANAERIGMPNGAVRIFKASGAPAITLSGDLRDHRSALAMVFTWLAQHNFDQPRAVVGHRVVFGGPKFRAAAVISPALCAALRELVPLDPEHLPQALDAMEFVREHESKVLQVACFDTAFHRDLPAVAQKYALPPKYFADGILRYGFHGLSYQFIVHTLRKLDGVLAEGRVIVAHLGNGASMAAIHAGRCIDTSMGFTPDSGLVMGTRAGDIDPGALLQVLALNAMDPLAVKVLINQHSGLLGVSGSSADMQVLLAREASDAMAAEAIALFCYRAKKVLGAYVAALGGLDVLVFTGGIGEHAAPVRERICAGLECLGIHIDRPRNQRGEAIISTTKSPVKVRVLPTDEGLMIAREAWELCRAQGRSGR